MIDLIKIWQLRWRLSRAERKHQKFQHSEQYKKLTPTKQYDADSLFYTGEYLEYIEAIRTLETKKLLRQATMLVLPFPKPWEDKDKKYYEKSQFDDDDVYLNDEGQHKLEMAILDKQRARRENWMWFVPISALITSILSLVVTYFSYLNSQEATNRQKQAQFWEARPYIMFSLFQTVLPYDKNSIFVNLPYQLQNIGKSPALKIRKEYKSILIDASGKEHKVQDYLEPAERTGDLLPSQSSPIHIDNINITGFDPTHYQSIRIEYTIYYNHEELTQTSKIILNLTPKMLGDKIQFFVTMPSQYYNFN